MKALVIVDVQNDFCSGGTLATSDGDLAAESIRALLHDEKAVRDYAHIVATQDWHIDPGEHFSENPDFIDNWPPHCRAGTPGAEMHPAVPVESIEAFFRKGNYSVAYSGFEGFCEGTSLAEWLRERKITAIDVVGIATDYCVKETALDGLRENFEVRILSYYCSPVDPNRGQTALDEINKAGAEVHNTPIHAL
ncbi:isochorismatase family protein [Corynebacterium lowii]|uniref:nicotinamidase n=1 Tax=Corynebacterium lowii TaxID=1544413 RepID=A0A0Q1DX55_9CORY|nr:isochorismatase family protein [Corynebacterium lowii]KQB84806.1 nicotinamidase/pyrazinamidase [Corynebacterium lowii]MDP9851710.1 nicotinamidase/pyrazinamidase [Corynebacterium lowii]